MKLWQITSSPSPTPKSINPKCNAAVPALNATTCFPSSSTFNFPFSIKKSRRAFSKAFTFGPNGTTQFVSNASCINSCSRPPMWANESQILFFIEKNLENKFIESQTPLTRLFYIYLISMLNIPQRIIFPDSPSTQNIHLVKSPLAIHHDKHYF